MPVIVSMLRGINVSGHKKIKMETLRESYAGLGLRNPRTYIQSGNVIFESEDQDLLQLSRRIENMIEQNFALHSDVILRTISEMESVLERNPFASRNDVEPNRLLVMFLHSDPGPQAHENIRHLPPAPEELNLIGRELYIHYPAGVSAAKLSPSVIDRALMKTRGTSRNWNTVRKLVDLAHG